MEKQGKVVRIGKRRVRASTAERCRVEARESEEKIGGLVTGPNCRPKTCTSGLTKYAQEQIGTLASTVELTVAT